MSEAEGDVSSTSELGIRSFFRGILPQWSKSSPVGAASPNQTNTNSIENGLDELHSSEQSHLKRKISLIRNDETDDSDYEEQLPTCKRQRVNMSAMSQLFSKFSINDSSTSKNQEQKVISENYFLNSSSVKEDNLIKLPSFSFNNETDGALSQTKKDIKETLVNNNKLHIANMNENTSSKNIMREENQALTNRKEEGTKQEAVSSSKRQITVSDDNDSDNDTEHVAKVKRTRRLRRGLKLCTDITCYIEQVIYS